MESALVRGVIANPQLLNVHEEAVLRTALSLARLYKVPHEGREVGVGAFLEPFREEMERRFKAVLLPERGGAIQRELLMPHLRELKDRTLHVRDHLAEHFRDRLPFEAIDRELRHKALVLVLGGGGGTAFPYLGSMALLDTYGLAPRLLAGTSMGAVLSLFRSRLPRYDLDEIISIIRALSWRKLFRVVSTNNRYGVPAALRLFLRAGIGKWFGVEHPGGPALRLNQLPIKTIICVCGIRAGKLPHSLDYYEGLTSAAPSRLLNPLVAPRWFGAIAEFVTRPEILTPIHLGADDETSEFDAVDAAGFSSALPGVIHYDVLRHDPKMHERLTHLLRARHVARLIDGGLVDNVPAKAAWRAVHKGQIGTRNAFILALNGFAPRLTTPLWLPLQQLAELNVKPNRAWAHLMIDFRKSLGALNIVPSVEETLEAVDIGRKALMPHISYLSRMLAPLPNLGAPGATPAR